MEKRIVAVNASPRSQWNTGTLVRRAAEGAQSAGAQVEVVDLYQLEQFTGCRSCFACKREPHLGECVYPDGLAGVLEKIRQADGLILGTPNYLSNVSAGCHALYERMIFQYITYKLEPRSYATRRIPVLFIMTSNGPVEYDEQIVAQYKGALDYFVGDTQTLISGNTLQVDDYERYDWTMFDVEDKRRRHEEVFPAECQQAFELGAGLVQR